MDRELKIVGEYGLRNKREVWRVQYSLAKVRHVARTLLTLPEKNEKRLFEGAALLRRLNRLGILNENELKLDFVLGLTVEKFLDRRLQTRVFHAGLAKSIHHARCLIKQRHIRVGKRMVDIPSFAVRVDSEKHIEFALTSPFGGGRGGRVRRKTERAGGSSSDAAEATEAEKPAEEENTAEAGRSAWEEGEPIDASSADWSGAAAPVEETAVAAEPAKETETAAPAAETPAKTEDAAASASNSKKDKPSRRLSTRITGFFAPKAKESKKEEKKEESEEEDDDMGLGLFD